MQRPTGNKYYTKNGLTKIHVRISKGDLVKLKVLAINKGRSVVSVVGEAMGWSLKNPDRISADIPEADKESKPFFTYLDKDTHKSIKLMSMALNKPLCDVFGYILTSWAHAGGEFDQGK